MGMPLRLGKVSPPLTPVADPCHNHSCKAVARRHLGLSGLSLLRAC